LKRIVDFPFKELLLRQTEGKKFLGILDRPILQIIEKKFTVDLGTKKGRRFRPCIFWKDSKGDFLFIFLTSLPTFRPINLELCPEKNRRCKEFHFHDFSFILLNRERKVPKIKLKDLNLIEKIYFCGSCDDLDFLEDLF